MILFVHIRRYFARMVIGISIVAIVVILPACADSVNVEQAPRLQILDPSVKQVTASTAVVTFTINQAASIFWVLYNAGTIESPDVETVFADANSRAHPSIKANSNGAIISNTLTQTIHLTDLSLGDSYHLYIAASNQRGESMLSEMLPITPFQNISAVTTARMSDGIIRVSWINPSIRHNRVLDRIEISWENAENEGGTPGNQASTNILTPSAQAYEILHNRLLSRNIHQLSLTAVYRDGSRLSPVVRKHYPVDADGDRLIDIYTVEALSSIRCNPSATAYRPLEVDGITCSNLVTRCGMDGAEACLGYELRRDLNFRDRASYASGVINPAWIAHTHGTANHPSNEKDSGWIPIDNLTALLEGNGHTIENLYVRDTSARDHQLSGLFGSIKGASAHVRNLTLKYATVYDGSGQYGHVGALAGELSGGTIQNVASIEGVVGGESGYKDRFGGLVGQNVDGGTIIASHATGTVSGGNSPIDFVGGLVGINKESTIIASYATGTVRGVNGYNDCVGGLVGQNVDGGIIIASYAIGNVDVTTGRNHNYNAAGGLVGFNQKATVISSYAMSSIEGKSADNFVGGFVGWLSISKIVASYTTVTINNITLSCAPQRNPYFWSGIDTFTGFAGLYEIIKDVYAFREDGCVYSGGAPTNARRASELTAPALGNLSDTAAPSGWDSVAEHTKGAWDFGNGTQAPALKYADYDGDGDRYNCDQFPAPCGTLIPGQR